MTIRITSCPVKRRVIPTKLPAINADLSRRAGGVQAASPQGPSDARRLDGRRAPGQHLSSPASVQTPTEAHSAGPDTCRVCHTAARWAALRHIWNRLEPLASQAFSLRKTEVYGQKPRLS